MTVYSFMIWMTGIVIAFILGLFLVSWYTMSPIAWAFFGAFVALFFTLGGVTIALVVMRANSKQQESFMAVNAKENLVHMQQQTKALAEQMRAMNLMNQNALMKQGHLLTAGAGAGQPPSAQLIFDDDIFDGLDFNDEEINTL